jgi:hypothetical protein
MRYMLLDGSNFLWRNRFAQIGKKFDSGNELDGFALHVSITSLQGLFKKHEPDKIVIAFDQGPYWRKDLLPMYKGNRDKSDKQFKDPKSLQVFFGHIDDFYHFIDQFSSIIALREQGIEADDWIARWVQTHPQEEHIIVSNDRDFHQLHKFPGVRQWNPMKPGAWVEVEDPKFALFEKCIRGETAKNSDNIPSAYPGIHTKKLQKAWEDSYAMNAVLLSEVPDLTNPGPDGKGQMTKVKDLFERNKKLIDLEQQPEEIKALMDAIIADKTLNPGNFDMFYFLKYLGKHELNRVAQNSDAYAKMLSS